MLSKSRGARNLLARIRTVMARFGLSSKRFHRLLKDYQALTRELGCVPTFPITAVVLQRHPRIIRDLHDQGVEFAVHGYVHIDYGVIPEAEQSTHYQNAVDIFQACRVPFTGFRAPFLRVNDRTFPALSRVGFPYDSSLAVHWDVIEKSQYTEEAWGEYLRVLEFYQSQPAEARPVLPGFFNGSVEIPISMPDDEITVERLGITEPEEIAKIWEAIVRKTYASGEMFTIQLHPERIAECGLALSRAVGLAKTYNPPVWIATLREIAEWWQERAGFSFDISPQDDGKYLIKAECSPRATVLVKNGKTGVPADAWYEGYKIVTEREFALESPRRPVIGVNEDSSAEALSFLRNEGYIVEKNNRPSDYTLYLDNLKDFTRDDERGLVDRIDESDATLVRYWRWPDRARSAASVTGDIDSITISDFVLRIIETSRENRRQRKLSRDS